MRLSVSRVVERKDGEPTACREGMVGAAILLDVLEDAVPYGDGTAAAVAISPIIATKFAGGHKRVVVGVGLRVVHVVSWWFGRMEAADTHVRLERRARVIFWSIAQIGHWRLCSGTVLEGSATGPQRWD